MTIFKNIRDELLREQFFKPRDEEALYDYYFVQLKQWNDGERLNAGQRLSPQFEAYKNGPNNSPMLTDQAAHVLRHVHYAYNIALSRLPAMVTALAPYFSTLRMRFTWLHLFDYYIALAHLLVNTAITDPFGNPILGFYCNEDSEHFE